MDCTRVGAEGYEVIKLVDLLNEALPKQKWVRLRGKDLDDHSDRIFSLINKSYISLGGHPTYSSPKSVTTGGDVKFWQVIDVDGDDEPDAVIAGKIRKKNVKIGLIATDGSGPAKSAVVKQQHSALGKYGYFAELSGRPAEIMLSMGSPVVKDRGLIEDLLNAKEIGDFKWLKGGWYQRRLRDGRLVQKIMVGVPKK